MNKKDVSAGDAGAKISVKAGNDRAAAVSMLMSKEQFADGLAVSLRRIPTPAETAEALEFFEDVCHNLVLEKNEGDRLKIAAEAVYGAYFIVGMTEWGRSECEDPGAEFYTTVSIAEYFERQNHKEDAPESEVKPRKESAVG